MEPRGNRQTDIRVATAAGQEAAETMQRLADDAAALAVFDEIRQSRKLPLDLRAEDAVAAILGTLSQCLGAAEARRLARSLAPPLQDLLRPALEHREPHAVVLSRRGFLERVARVLRLSEGQAEELSQTLFASLRRHLPGVEIDDVAKRLPDDLRTLWVPGRAQ